MGAAFVMQRARGIDPMQSGIGPVILLNLALGFIIPNISIGGHLGGLVGGARWRRSRSSELGRVAGAGIVAPGRGLRRGGGSSRRSAGIAVSRRNSPFAG